MATASRPVAFAWAPGGAGGNVLGGHRAVDGEVITSTEKVSEAFGHSRNWAWSRHGAVMDHLLHWGGGTPGCYACRSARRVVSEARTQLLPCWAPSPCPRGGDEELAAGCSSGLARVSRVQLVVGYVPWLAYKCHPAFQAANYLIKKSIGQRKNLKGTVQPAGKAC